MIKEYPGNPDRRDAIQSDILRATGKPPAMMRCHCGKPPYIISHNAGQIRVACICGFQSESFAEVQDAVNDWNYQMKHLELESIR